MIRKLTTALLLVPLAVVFMTLAVANRQTVVVSFDPFDHANPAFVVAMPLFALVLGLLIAGVLIGGVATWLRQSRWRRTARRALAQAGALRAELERFKRRMGAAEFGTQTTTTADYRASLTIPPPAA
jgi:uncharacterized integral membrane protein